MAIGLLKMLGPCSSFLPWSCVCTLQDILIQFSLRSIVRKSFGTYIITRMKMVVGVSILKATAPCSAQLSITFACGFSGKDQMVARTMLVQGQGSGFMIMAVLQTYLLGGRLGSPYLVSMTGLDATQCPQNFGCSPHFFPCIQVFCNFICLT
uniref:Germanicol synthase n=1 Tax=Rhizophora mucronata TaxID=61149 RepID=A0A2P2MRV9_RHIMU